MHDIGYSQSGKESPFSLSVRARHMRAGKKLSKEILEKVGYPTAKIRKIVSYVSVHDNWAFGEHKLYQADKILGVFNDLDFISMLSQESFSAMTNFLGQNALEFLEHMKHNEKVVHRPFSTGSTASLYRETIYLTEQQLKYA